MSTRTRPRWRRWRDYSVPCKKGGGLGCQVGGPVGRGIASRRQSCGLSLRQENPSHEQRDLDERA